MAYRLEHIITGNNFIASFSAAAAAADEEQEQGAAAEEISCGRRKTLGPSNLREIIMSNVPSG